MTTINFAAPAILMFSLQPGNDTTALKKATCDERRRPRRATPPIHIIYKYIHRVSGFKVETCRTQQSPLEEDLERLILFKKS